MPTECLITNTITLTNISTLTNWVTQTNAVSAGNDPQLWVTGLGAALTLGTALIMLCSVKEIKKQGELQNKSLNQSTFINVIHPLILTIESEMKKISDIKDSQRIEIIDIRNIYNAFVNLNHYLPLFTPLDARNQKLWGQLLSIIKLEEDLFNMVCTFPDYNNIDNKTTCVEMIYGPYGTKLMYTFSLLFFSHNSIGPRIREIEFFCSEDSAENLRKSKNSMTRSCP